MAAPRDRTTIAFASAQALVTTKRSRSENRRRDMCARHSPRIVNILFAFLAVFAMTLKLTPD